MGKITINELSNSLREYIENNTENKQDKTDSSLKTTDKTIVGAINELFQSANNGKELIANAIGEPLSSDDTFSAMSNDINRLLSTFKTNMMNSGVTVESGDKFKQLIDKIEGLTEGEGNKGIQYAEGAGIITDKIGEDTWNYQPPINISTDLDFVPTIVFVTVTKITYKGYHNSSQITDYETNCTLNSFITNSKNTAVSVMLNDLAYDFKLYINNLSSESFDLNLKVSLSGSGFMKDINYHWFAIGVGEEDTTLRDSLASILQDEGVNVTEEDDIASLISKVEDEITEKNNEINSRVIPAGNAVAEDVVSGKTFINSTGQLVTGSYIKPPDTAVLYPGTVSLFNLSASNIRPRDYHDGDGDFTRPLKVTCSTSIPKSGWYKIDLTMYETKDFPVEYRIITYTYVNNASKVINLVGKTASKYNGYYCNFTRSFYLYLMAGLPLELQIQGHSVFTSSEYGRLSYTIKCDYTG